VVVGVVVGWANNVGLFKFWVVALGGGGSLADECGPVNEVPTNGSVGCGKSPQYPADADSMNCLQIGAASVPPKPFGMYRLPCGYPTQTAVEIFGE
jgi:hypothetical protein